MTDHSEPPAVADPGLLLWYDEPATDWETRSLPIGNGAMGACVFGGIGAERLQYNEKTLWTGGPAAAADAPAGAGAEPDAAAADADAGPDAAVADADAGPDAGDRGWTGGNWTGPRPGALARVRERIDAEGGAAPEWVAGELGQPRVGYGAYQSFGDLEITGLPEAGVTGYRRWLDLGTALAGVAHRVAGVEHTREYFASHPDQVIVARLTAEAPARVDCTVRLRTPDNRTVRVTARQGRITCAGRLHDNGLRYESQVLVRAEGGTVTDHPDGSVTVAGARAVLLLLAAGTDYAPRYPDYRGTDPHPQVTDRVDRAAGRGYPALRDRHLADHRDLFDRVRLDLGQADPGVPTDELLRRYRGGVAGPGQRRALEALHFQYGRYLLIASSRPGSLPANLQGVWNDSADPPWSADYHTNVNLQMLYWPAEVTNLAETTAPLFDFVDSLMPPGAVTAREMFGARGWVVHDETTPFGFTGVHDWATAFWFPEAGAWLARHHWEHWLFTADETFLRERAWPVLRSLAEFWLDVLVTDPRDGRLVVNPSYSPEHGPFTAGAAMSQQIVRDLLTTTRTAARLVGDDSGLPGALTTALDRLDPGLRVGSWGQLREWKHDGDDPADTHRHVSHLYALHPADQLDPDRDPELVRAAERTLRARGDGGTGWSRAWKISFWARLRDGDHAHLMLAELLAGSTLDNLWDTHPPFQLDGNLGATAGVAEMLLQSHLGALHPLPALPACWPRGSVTGLRARGDLTLDLTWESGRATRLTLRPGRTGPITVRGLGPVVVTDDTGAPVPTRTEGELLHLTGSAGRTYLLVVDGSGVQQPTSSR